MARERLVQNVFGGLYAAPNDGAANMAYDLLNVRLQDGVVEPRYGYRLFRNKPTGFTKSNGLVYAVGYNETSVQKELISVANLGGVIRPYRVNADSTYTQITNNGNSVSMSDERVSFVQFGGELIAITPNGTNTAWRHEIGNLTSWTALDNSDYEPVANAPTISVSTNPVRQYQIQSGDTISYNQLNGAGIAVGTVTYGTPDSTGVWISGDNDDDGIPARQRLAVTFAVDQNWSAEDYFSVEVEAGTVLPKLLNTTPNAQINIGGTWNNVECQMYTTTNGSLATYIIRLESLAGISAVRGFRFEILTEVARYTTGQAVRIRHPRLGGQYLNSTSASLRPWNQTAGVAINYAVRYKTGSTYSPIASYTLGADQARGSVVSYATNGLGSYGAYVVLTAAENGAWTDVEFLRQVSGTSTYKIIGTVSATGTPQFRDIYSEYELTSLVTATDVTGDVPTQPPAFQSTGIKCAAGYKSWLVWGFSGGFGNIRMSRVGDAYELFDADVDYQADDETQPANFTMSDNGNDEPVAIVSTGEVLYALGNYGVYATIGDSPRSCKPFRQINNASGVAGRFASTAFQPDGKSRALVYMDVDGLVWAIANFPQFDGDASGDPIELSAPAGSRIKEHLIQDGDSLADVVAVVNPNDQSLWFILGKHAAIFRTNEAVENGWELYTYQIVSPNDEICTVFGYGSATVDTHIRSGWTDDWANPSNALNSNNTYATAVMGSGDKTKWLRVNNIKSSTIPSDATLNSLTFQFEHSTSGGNVIVLNDSAYLMHNGAQLGDNKATLAPVPNSDTLVNAVFTAPFPDGVNTALYNSGTLGFELGYTAGTYVTNGADISITLPTFQRTDGATTIPPTTHTHTITVNWIGTGPAPQYALLNITGTADAGGYASGGSPTNFAGSGSVTGVNGTVVSASIEAPTVDFDEFINVTESKSPVLVTFVGNTGTAQVTMSGNVTLTTAGMNNFGYVRTEVTAATLVAPSATTVRVDNVSVQACYTPAPTPAEWEHAAHNPDTRTILTQRNSGHIDELEYNSSSSNAPIVGVNRDGGQQMPNGYYVTQPIDSTPRKSRLVYSNAQLAGTGTNPDVVVDSDGTVFTSQAIGNSPARRFVSHAGWRLLPKIIFTETTAPITNISLELNRLSKTRF